MTPAQFKIFCDFRNSLKEKISEWSRFNDELSVLQKRAADDAGTPPYNIETPIVYNTALDDFTESDNINLIVIGDNPGKNEQLKINQKYLVGQAGKIGEGFFARNPALGIDFRKNVIILNKTPVHSAKTNQLKYIKKNASPELQKMLIESELWMARETAKLHIGLCEKAMCPGNCAMCGGGNSADGKTSASHAPIAPQLWLVGYAELRGKGLFLPYRDELVLCYKKGENTGNSGICNTNSGNTTPPVGTPMFTGTPSANAGTGGLREEWNYVFVYQHFSMNRFTIDLGEFCKEQANSTGRNLPLGDALQELGKLHRREIFGV